MWLSCLLERTIITLRLYRGTKWLHPIKSSHFAIFFFVSSLPACFSQSLRISFYSCPLFFTIFSHSHFVIFVAFFVFACLLTRFATIVTTISRRRFVFESCFAFIRSVYQSYLVRCLNWSIRSASLLLFSRHRPICVHSAFDLLGVPVDWLLFISKSSGKSIDSQWNHIHTHT